MVAPNAASTQRTRRCFITVPPQGWGGARAPALCPRDTLDERHWPLLPQTRCHGRARSGFRADIAAGRRILQFSQVERDILTRRGGPFLRGFRAERDAEQLLHAIDHQLAVGPGSLRDPIGLADDHVAEVLEIAAHPLESLPGADRGFD